MLLRRLGLRPATEAVASTRVIFKTFFYLSQLSDKFLAIR